MRTTAYHQRNYLYLRRRGQIPWGYQVDADDKQLLKPIIEHLDALQEAKRWLKRDCTYREVANWLSKKTGTYISHVTLHKLAKQKYYDPYIVTPTTEEEAKAISKSIAIKCGQIPNDTDNK